jgi:transposase-like protein
MTDERNSDVTPESLMDNFKGPKLVRLLIITVVAHVVVVLVTSLPYLKDSLFGKDTSKMSQEEKIKIAVADASASIRKIAEKHGLTPQDISAQFSTGGSRTAAKVEPAETVAKEPDVKPSEPERPKSEIEKKIETISEGPKVPDFANKDDIF